MTPDQEKQFNTYGCVSRSIIKATEIRNVPISKVDFIARYSHLFPKDQCGLLAIDGFCEVVKDLGLAKRVNSTVDISYIIDCVNRKMISHIFMLSERSLPNLDVPNNHCRLVIAHGLNPTRTQDALIYFCPLADGSDNNEEWIPCSAVSELMVHFLVLIQ